MVLRVRDTGVGMSEQDIAVAMEPFRQLATSARWGSGGTGLGLPLTKALAEANRASFRIKSTVNTGTWSKWRSSHIVQPPNSSSPPAFPTLARPAHRTMMGWRGLVPPRPCATGETYAGRKVRGVNIFYQVIRRRPVGRADYRRPPRS